MDKWTKTKKSTIISCPIPRNTNRRGHCAAPPSDPHPSYRLRRLARRRSSRRHHRSLDKRHSHERYHDSRSWVLRQNTHGRTHHRKSGICHESRGAHELRRPGGVRDRHSEVPTIRGDRPSAHASRKLRRNLEAHWRASKCGTSRLSGHRLPRHRGHGLLHSPTTDAVNTPRAPPTRSPDPFGGVFAFSKEKALTRGQVLFLVTPRGVGLASRVAVAPLGLATASRFRLVSEHRSGVRLPDASKTVCLLEVTQ